MAASVLALTALCATSVAAQGGGEGKRVLLLFSYQADQGGQLLIEQGIRSTLRAGSSDSLEIYSEYLDSVRTQLDEDEIDLVGHLNRKYKDKKFDLLFAVNVPALKFLLKNRAVFFPDAPIVFHVLDQRDLNGLDLGSNVTGVWGEIKFKPTMELALALHPGTRRVVLISGVSDLDNYLRNRAQGELRDFEGSVEVSHLIGLTPSELKTALAGLPPQTIVLFVVVTRDKAGNNTDNLEVLRQICPASSAPVYGSSYAQMGLGIVGGKFTSYEESGVESGRVGLRVLAGEKPEAIAPHGVPSVPMFDWRALKRWGINEDRLPPGSIVRFKVPSFWEEYRGRIVLTLMLIILQTGFIAALLIERKRRQLAREALAQLNTELEQRVASRTAALDSKSRELETFAYSVAHDLKAPLRGIDGYSRLLVEEYSEVLPEEARSFVETIQTSTEEMGQLIDDLLAYSRLERRELKLDRLELEPLVTRLVEQKRREATERNIDFVVDVNCCTVMADANGLIQSLRNYLDNAVKFTQQVPQPRIEVGAKETTTNCLLWVRDNGIGFDSKDHDKIFGIFQRLNPAEDYPGTGIGLAIVRKAMERMGGRAWAESSPGQGATFYLEIPKTNSSEVNS